MNIKANRFIESYLKCSCQYCRKEIKNRECRLNRKAEEVRQNELSVKQKDLTKLARKIEADEQEEINKKLAVEIVEMRKQLFNGEKLKTSEGAGRNEPGLLRIRHKFTNPDLPHPSLKRLIPRCRQNVEFWLKEQEEKEKKFVLRNKDK